MIPGSVLVLGLLLTGCGGDDSDDDASASDDSSATSSDAPETDGTDEPEGEESEEPDDAGEDDADEVDVCALLSAADLQKAFGSPFDDGELTHQEQTGGDQCVWANTDAPPVKVFSVTLLRDGHFPEGFGGGDYTVAQLHEDTKAFYTDTEPVDLGDDAYLAGTELIVLDGSEYWTFSTTTGTSAKAINGMKTLAAQVVG